MMRKMAILPIIGYVFLFIATQCWTNTNASAQGQMILKPNIEAGWQSDSNFYKSEADEKQVYTYNVKPGIKFGYTTGKSDISIDYWFNVLRYDDQDDIPQGYKEADEYDYVKHYGWFTAQTQATDRLQVGIDNLFQSTRDPAAADINSNAVDRYKYLLNNFSPRLLYRFGEKFDVGIKYKNLITDYTDDDIGEGEDSTENRGTLTLYYNLNTRTAFDLDYQVWNRNYDKTTSDYTSNQVMLNLNHQFNYFTLGLGAGYHARNFDADVAGGDIGTVAWQVSLTGQNPPDTDGIPKSAVNLSVGNNFNDSGSGETYYDATRFELDASYLLFDRLNCQLTAWYQIADYETSDREDDRWYGSLAVDYWFHEIFAIGLEGGLEERDSNEQGRDFDNQFIMLNVQFNYDMGSK